MRRRYLLPIVCVFAVSLLSGCKDLPGYPKPAWQPPKDETSFKVLYTQNCASCHGENGRNGTAIALNNPEYLAIANDAALHQAITNGVPDSLMPAFAMSAGGMLTSQQVDILVNGIRQHWGQPNALAGATPPAYLQPATGGNAQQGRQNYIQYCLSCHNSKQTNITNTSYLALISDQALRSIIIAGRPDLGQPDWRNDKPGHPLTDQEVTDIVTYLGSLRVQNPGQPYSSYE